MSVIHPDPANPEFAVGRLDGQTRIVDLFEANFAQSVKTEQKSSKEESKPLNITLDRKDNDEEVIFKVGKKKVPPPEPEEKFRSFLIGPKLSCYSSSR